MIEWLICTDDYGEEFRSSSLAEVYVEWRRLLEDDKAHSGIKREYTFFKCEPDGMIEHRTEVKIYRRGNRVYWKAI